MAKPNGQWLQNERQLSNPYMGKRMPRCGSLTELVGGGGEPARLLADYFAIRAAMAGDALKEVKPHASILSARTTRPLLQLPRASRLRKTSPPPVRRSAT